MRYTCLTALILLIFGCDDASKKMTPEDWGDDVPLVRAAYETETANIDGGVDAADDPAIWIHPADPAKSLIIGTNKVRGISSYRLNGQEVQFEEYGRANNVDVRYGFEYGGKMIDLIGFTERKRNEIVVVGINSDGLFFELDGGRIPSELDEVYGFCFYHDPDSRKLYAFANDKTGAIDQWSISLTDNRIEAKLVRRLRIPSQPEGMVADDPFGVLYAGEENAGIWKFDANPEGGDDGFFLLQSSEKNTENIAYDIEGLAIYPTTQKTGYLIASSQGNNSFAVFRREDDNAYLGSFRVQMEESDDVRDTDGIEVTAIGLGSEFPRGIFVAQDGINYDNGELAPQNFKIVDFRQVLGCIAE